MNLYNEKSKQYFSNVRYDLIKLLPNVKLNSVLEVGAGGGDTILKIKEMGLAQKVTGIELMEINGSNQHNKEIDQFIFGNIETDSFDLEEKSFDVIICGDVLEHLIEPWRTVQKLSTLLKKEGILIISCPNIRHYTGLFKIFIKGDFTYTKEGLFDRTHFRFFCKKNLKELAESGGLKVKTITPLFKLVEFNKSYVVNVLTLGLLEQFFALQYVIVAYKED